MKTSIQFRLLGSLLAGAAALLATTIHAQQINYQGRLTDNSGNPLTDGQYTLTFNLYTAATNGTKIWGPFITDAGAGDGHSAKAELVNGRFNVILGSKDTVGRSLVSGFGGDMPYLEIQVGANPPISPRQQVLAAPRALFADTVPDGAIGTAQLADGSVTAAKLSGGVGAWLTAPDGTNIYRSLGRVGIGTTSPTAKLTVNGGVQARGGAPGVGGANDNGFAFAGNNGDNDSGMFSSADGLVEFYGNAVERMRIAASGNVGIGTPNPGAKLDVNGTIQATSITVSNLTVNGTLTATSSAGEKAPVTYTVAIGPTNTYRDVLLDGTALLGDADGGRIKILLRNHNTKTVRVMTYDFYAENDQDNFNPGSTTATRSAMLFDAFGREFPLVLGAGTLQGRTGFSDNFGNYFTNYRRQEVTGNNEDPAFGPADRYKLWFTVAPGYSATVILYDR